MAILNSWPLNSPALAFDLFWTCWCKQEVALGLKQTSTGCKQAGVPLPRLLLQEKLGETGFHIGIQGVLGGYTFTTGARGLPRNIRNAEGLSSTASTMERSRKSSSRLRTRSYRFPGLLLGAQNPLWSSRPWKHSRKGGQVSQICD